MITFLVFGILFAGALTLLSGLLAAGGSRRPAPRLDRGGSRVAGAPLAGEASPETIERPFTGEFWDHAEDGTYCCVSCGAPLFDARTKFDAGDGWPNFRRPVHGAAVGELNDISYGRVRTAAVCRGCDARLGHVFSDGRGAAARRRYCLNSGALAFRPRHGEIEPQRRAQ